MPIEDKPLLVVPQAEATANIAGNPAAYWKSTVGRAHTGALRTYIAPKVLLRPDEPIYAIGSCFALELEKALAQRGSPVLSAIGNSEPFLKREMLTRYNVPSMWREFERCLVDPSPMGDLDLVVETDDGGFRDTHYYALDRQRSLDMVRTRRAAARRAFRRIKDARVVILTLGLNEIWYDPDSDGYLNTWADLKLIARKPNLEIRVLSAAANVAYLERIHALLTAVMPHDFKIIVSVSPVALSATFTADDVIVANMRSKSILRAAAEEFVAAHDNVHYFPSYEISMCSAVSDTFQADGRHVKPTMAAHIIQTFTDAHMAPDRRVDAA
jgi:hypothetical protein